MGERFIEVLITVGIFYLLSQCSIQLGNVQIKQSCFVWKDVPIVEENK